MVLSVFIAVVKFALGLKKLTKLLRQAKVAKSQLRTFEVCVQELVEVKGYSRTCGLLPADLRDRHLVDVDSATLFLLVDEETI